MGRAPCCDKANVKKGPWSPEEDAKLREYIEKHGTGGNWIALPQKAGLKRCGKSCRLRWLNYLRPNIKHGEFSDEEDRIICGLYANIGSRWSIIAAQLPGRTDNDIKNYWNTKLKKKLMILSPSLPQRKLHQAINTGFSSLLQATSLPSSPSTVLSSPSSSPYSSYTLPRSFTEPIVPFSSSPLSSSNNSFSTSAPILQSQESFLSPSQQYQVKDSLLIFGGDQASCSSSDVSSNKQMMQAREIEYEYGGGGGGVENSTGHQQMGCQRYFCDGVEENRKSLLLSNRGGVHGWSSEKQNGLWGDNPVDYGLEEIKQLISTGGCTSFWFDENKADEKVMYH